MEPWPLDSTKRSRLAQAGLLGLWRKCRPHKATAMSAMPMGAPGWPEFAACTASIAKARMALAWVCGDTVEEAEGLATSDIKTQICGRQRRDAKPDILFAPGKQRCETA